ncbi:MAG: hypothetical protein AAGF85_20450 [Bacteroidota bacterium]
MLNYNIRIYGIIEIGADLGFPKTVIVEKQEVLGKIPLVNTHPKSSMGYASIRSDAFQVGRAFHFPSSAIPFYLNKQNFQNLFGTIVLLFQVCI